MPKLNNRTILIGGAGLILLFLVYRYYQNNVAGGTAATTTGATPADQSGADYASLAGQEQADIAGVSGQEASDIGNLQNEIGGLTGSLGSLTSTVGGLSTPVTGATGATGAAGAPGVSPKAIKRLTTEVGVLQKEMVKMAAGQRRHSTTTHRPAKKAGTGKKASGSPHVNANHPTGTAGHAIAGRSHHPPKKAHR